MAKYIVCTFAYSQSIMNSRETSKVLGVDRIRNIKKAFERQLLLDTSCSNLWIDYKRAKHSDSLLKHFQ
jgi:hypothetical protein